MNAKKALFGALVVAILAVSLGLAAAGASMTYESLVAPMALPLVGMVASGPPLPGKRGVGRPKGSKGVTAEQYDRLMARLDALQGGIGTVSPPIPAPILGNLAPQVVAHDGVKVNGVVVVVSDAKTPPWEAIPRAGASLGDTVLLFAGNAAGNRYAVRLGVAGTGKGGMGSFPDTPEGAKACLAAAKLFAERHKL